MEFGAGASLLALPPSGICGSGRVVFPLSIPPKTASHLQSPLSLPVPLCRVVVRGHPLRHRDALERPPLKQDKTKSILIVHYFFTAYFVLSVVDNSLLSYIKKYLNAVQCAMPRAGVVKAIGSAARRSLGSSWF